MFFMFSEDFICNVYLSDSIQKILIQNIFLLRIHFFLISLLHISHNIFSDSVHILCSSCLWTAKKNRAGSKPYLDLETVLCVGLHTLCLNPCACSKRLKKDGPEEG